MAYPRELNLDSDAEQRLISYLEDELTNHYAERGGHIDDLKRWQKHYWATPTTKKATFPFTGASTIIIPLDAIAVESIHARMMTTRFALPGLVSAHPIASDWEDAAQPVESFMNSELLDRMRIRRPMGDCFLEATKFGTMIGKVGYERLVKTSVREINGREEEYDVVVKDGAEFDPVPDARFLMPNYCKDPQTAPWVGEEHSLPPYEVMMLEAGGLFKPRTIIDGPNAKEDVTQQAVLKAWINRAFDFANPSKSGNDVERAQEILEHTESQWPKRIDWVEIHLAFDIDQSGRPKEIVVHYHREARYLMSVRYNIHPRLIRPYRTNVYFPVEHRWRGIGICKQNEQFQAEVTAIHRQRLDNATLANMRMIKISKLSGYGPNEPVFPGKMWFLDSMDMIDSFQLGEVYPSAYSNEQAAVLFSQQRTGVNEVMLGQPQVGTPGTATSDLARIQEGNKKFDFVYDNFNEFVGDIILDIADTIQAYGPRRLPYFDVAENGELVREFFQMPSTYIRDGLLLSLKESTQRQNRLLDRQNWTQLSPMLVTYFQEVSNLAQMVGDPKLLGTIALKGMSAATEAMRQILESFDVRNIDRIVLREIEEQIQNGLQGIGAKPGGRGQPGAPSQIPGMDLLTQIVQSTRNGSNGGAGPVQVR